MLSEAARTRESYVVMQDVGRQLFSESVLDEVTLGLDAKDRAEVDVAALLAGVQLTGMEQRHPQSLSGGQRQRLVIASAMAQPSRVTIFDEPTSGVGRAHLQAIAGQMRALAEAGHVVIVITHDEELIDSCADAALHLPDINHAREDSETR